MSENNSKIINWDSVFSYSEKFQNNSPCKWAFIEEFFDRKFYEKLYNTFPQDDIMKRVSAVDKDSLRTLWGDDSDGHDPTDYYDSRFSDSWNQFHHYLFDEEFINNMQKFSGVDVNKLKHFSMKISRKGDYQSPHIHNTGPSTVIFMVYFTKNWKKEGRQEMAGNGWPMAGWPMAGRWRKEGGGQAKARQPGSRQAAWQPERLAAVGRRPAPQRGRPSTRCWAALSWRVGLTGARAARRRTTVPATDAPRCPRARSSLTTPNRSRRLPSSAMPTRSSRPSIN